MVAPQDPCLRIRVICQYSRSSHGEGCVFVGRVGVIIGRGWIVNGTDRDGYRGWQIAVCSSIVGKVSKGISAVEASIWRVGEAAIAV
jgi:hypothetical protein